MEKKKKKKFNKIRFLAAALLVLDLLAGSGLNLGSRGR